MKLTTRVLVPGVCLLFSVSILAKADGVMRPTNSSYPKDFLRHRLTSISVAIHGQVAVTTVYQEFVNEWTQPTNAVYSFPLPPDARATDFLFWSNDTLYRASLKVKEQAVNPGTGEGGVDALLTTYLGSNPLRVLVNDIPAGQVQRIQMEFVSLCKSKSGKLVYQYPLATTSFTIYPVESVFLNFQVDGSDDVTNVELEGFPTSVITRTDSKRVSLSLDRSKVYLTDDLTFNAYSNPDSLSVDFYATKSDSLGGNFVLFLKPPSIPDSSTILPKKVVFLIDCSSSVSGETMVQTVQAIRDCLDRLRPTDVFNVVGFNYSPIPWSAGPVAATPDAILLAKTFLEGLTPYGYSNLQPALVSALGMFTSDSMNNVLLLFSDGRAPVNPATIRAANTVKVAVFPIAIGDNIRRSVVETIAYQNYGTPTFIASTEAVLPAVTEAFDHVNDPLLRDVHMEMGSNAYDLHPGDLASVYGGSRFFLAGRYQSAGTASLSVGGTAPGGPQFYNFLLTFPELTNQYSFAAKLWAKEKIDDIERTIDIYGATDSLKTLDISLSLQYRIRCMYTAYVADKTNRVAEVEETASIQTFSALAIPDGVMLTWAVAGHSMIREINLYRGETPTGPFVKVNNSPLQGNSYLDHVSWSTPWYEIEIVTMDGRHIWSTPVSSNGHILPTTTTLLQNYPNPFNPTTVISGQWTVDSKVTVVVYDLVGREVAVLADGRYPAGRYRFTFDASRLASGVYFCRLTAGSFVSTRSMLLLR